MVIIGKIKEKRQKYCFLFAVILCLCVTSCDTLSNKEVVHKGLLGTWENTSKTSFSISNVSDEDTIPYEYLIPHFKDATWRFADDTLWVLFYNSLSFDLAPIAFRSPYNIHEENNEFFIQSTGWLKYMDAFLENLRIVSLTDKELVMTTNTPYNTKGVIADYYLVRHN